MTYVSLVFAIVVGSIAAGLIGRLIGSVAERFVDPDVRVQARYFFGSYLMLVNIVVGAITACVACLLHAGFLSTMCWTAGVAVAWPLIIWIHHVIGRSIHDADAQLQERIYKSPTVAFTFLLSQILKLIALATSGRVNFVKKSRPATEPANNTATPSNA